jgi:WD40 repeat protein
MTSRRNDDSVETPLAEPSLTGTTHTGEPIPKDPRNLAAARDAYVPRFPTQPRSSERYQFLGEHGRGGLGRVSRVHDRDLGRDVAIKELLSRDNVQEVRFLREVLITARLEHPGIVPIHEAGRWPDGTPFYAMKLVSGRSLRDLLAERTTVEQRLDLLHHVIAVADAIAYAHGRNIIHRDLKPANVIVGDFGETVVIDWGLAKDLTSPETSALGSGAFPSNRAEDLTSAGSVLGTPAYMAPEQERGEAVDQRADVYAIGVMLWEICTVQKLPPSKSYLRHRVLRRAGIDPDLATIIDKALERAPEHRYRDAGPLAADLKAFKAGARIAARSYSLLAMLAHWTRRHRMYALSAVAAVALAGVGSLLSVRDIAAERDRADTSEKAAQQARASAEASLDELTLKHAQILLATDPSATIDALETYHGADLARANQIHAEANGRGVAVLRALPHTDNVFWIQGAPDGAVLSLSTDGTIARTSRDGTSVVLVRGVSKSGLSLYSPARHLLAYACDPSDLCLFDVLHTARIPSAAALRGSNTSGLSFSPDGAFLALMSRDAVLRILDITDPAQPVVRLARATKGGVDVEFVGDNVVAVGSAAGVEFIRTDGASESFSFPGIAHWAAGTSDHELALATAMGQAVVLAYFPLRIATRADLCHGSIAGLQFIPGRRSIAYACHEGAMGVWDLQVGLASPRAQLEGHADLITTSSAGDYVVAAGGNGTVTVLDLVTDLVTTYKGHGFRLTSLAPPAPAHPVLISGDARGAVRAWPLPTRVARLAATSSTPFQAAIFDDQSATVTATTWRPTLAIVSPSTGARAVGPHELENIFLERSRSGKIFATYGLHDLVEIWSSATMTRTRVFRTGHGSVSQLRFAEDTDDFLTSGHDGRLVRWKPSGEQTLVAQIDQPIDKFAQVPAAGSIVFSTVDGALWRTDDSGQARSLRSGGARVNRIVVLPGQQTMYAGYASGDVVAIDTRSWQQETILQGAGAVRDIAATEDGHTLAVATNDGTIHVGTHREGARFPGGLTWVALAARARHIALAPDGLLVAACTDGTIWLYSVPLRRWLCLPTGTADLGPAVMAAGGKAAVVLDFEGRLLWIDLDAARKRLD